MCWNIFSPIIRVRRGSSPFRPLVSHLSPSGQLEERHFSTGESRAQETATEWDSSPWLGFRRGIILFYDPLPCQEDM